MSATVTELHPDLDYPVDRDTVPSHFIVDQAGITFRKVDHWTRAGYLHPLPRLRSDSGYPREYPRTELAVACLMAQLVDAGINPQMACFYARQLLENGTTRIAGITLHLPNDY